MSVEARCRNAIDYSKSVNPVLEQAILDRIDADLFYKAASIGIAIDSSCESLLYSTEETMDTAKKLLRPWVEQTAGGNSSAVTIEDMAARWLQQFGDKVNGGVLGQSN